MSRFWIGVASANHVRIGRKDGFMQLGHGKVAPLKRVSAGDGFIYYSPTIEYGVADNFKSFVAIGRVKPGEPYLGDMGNGFKPYRRHVDWFASQESPIWPLLPALDFTAGKKNWGFQLRFGLFEISQHDWQMVMAAMQASES
jgi:EVE domain